MMEELKEKLFKNNNSGWENVNAEKRRKDRRNIK